MAHYMDIGKDARLIFDLIWVQAADHSNNAIREAAGDAKQIVVIKRNDGDAMVGIYTPSTEEEKTRRKLVSFAGIIALRFHEERSALVMVDMADGMSAVAAIANGLPVPDTDRYGRTEDVIEVALEFISDNPGTSIYGNTNKLGSHSVTPFDLTEFLNDKETKKLIRACQIRKTSKTHKTIILAAALVLAGGYVAYDHIEQKRKAEEAARLAAQQKTPEQIYNEGLRDAIRQQGLPASAARQMVALARKQETSVNGWRITRLRCSSSGCDATWTRSSKIATFSDLIDAVGKEGLQIATDQTAVKHISGQFSYKEDEFPDPQTIPSEQEAWIKLLSPLQRTAGVMNFGISAASVLPVAGVTIPNGVRKAEINVTGPAWGDSYFTSLPQWVMVREINYTLNANDVGHLTTDGTIIMFTR